MIVRVISEFGRGVRKNGVSGAVFQLEGALDKPGWSAVIGIRCV